MKHRLFLLSLLLLSAGLLALTWRIPQPLVLEFGGKSYELFQSHCLRWLAVLPLLAFPLRVSLSDLPWQQRLGSGVFRALFLLLGVVALSDPRVKQSSERQAVVFLLDVSTSVSDAALAEAIGYVDEARRQAPSDAELRCLVFAGSPRALPLVKGETLGTPAELRRLAPPTGLALLPQTDLQAALQLALASFPEGTLKRLVLLSDGLETLGEARRVVQRAKELGVKIVSVPPTVPPAAEIAVRALTAPAKVSLGEPFQLEAELYATRAGKVVLHLFQGTATNTLDAARELELPPGVTRVKFQTVVQVPGEVVYKITLAAQGEDSIAENNQGSVRVVVAGRPSVLYIEGQPQRASYLTRALIAQQFDVDQRPASALPSNASELGRFDFVVLSDVPESAVDATRQSLIERYVTDGGGFLFAGGDAGYQLGGWRNSTLERLLPVRMESTEQKENPGVALALVIDRSGSMSGLPLEMAKAACQATVTTLSPSDLIEVIAFDGAPTRYVKTQPARYVARIQGEIARIQVGGGTAIFPALDAAYQDLSVVQARRKHVILLTDGRAETQGIRDLVQAMLTDSITVTTVGLGDGVDSDFLRMISENGGGRYHHAPDPSHLPRIFTRETEFVAPKSSAQDWFSVTQTARADFLNGLSIASAPLLHGYVATQLKPAPAQQILAHENGDPILARWRVGLGHSLAWTSDLKNGWAIDWLRWPEFSKFFGQLVREHMRRRARREIPMRVELRGDFAVAVVDAFTEQERFENGLTSRLKVTGSDASKAREYAFRQTAPGRYEAEIPLDQYGAFTLEAAHQREDENGVRQKLAVSYARFSNPYPKEYARFEADLSLLQQLAQETHGSFAAPAAKLFSTNGEQVVEWRPLWPRLLPWMLASFFLDLLLRRVRWFDRAFSKARQ